MAVDDAAFTLALDLDFAMALVPADASDASRTNSPVSDWRCAARARRMASACVSPSREGTCQRRTHRVICVILCLILALPTASMFGVQ